MTARSLDDYYGTEEDVMNEAPLEGDALTTLLKSSGTVEDKLRLYVIALTSGKGLSTVRICMCVTLDEPLTCYELFRPSKTN